MSKAIGRRWLRRLMGVALAGLFAIGGLAAAEDAGAPETAAEPATAAVVRGTLERTLPVVGEFRAHQTVKLAPQVGGRVVEVLADVGDRVTPDKAVVVIDKTFLQLDWNQQAAALKLAEQRVETLKAGIRTAEVDIEQAKLARADAALQFERMRKLYDKPAGEEPSVSKKMYDDAQLRLKQAEVGQAQAEQRVREAAARVAEATVAQEQIQAAMATLERKIAETEVKPKFAAVVTARLVAPGDMVASAPATTLMELQDLAHLELLFNVPQEQAAVVKAGSPVRYRVPGLAGEREAQIERILPLGDAATRSYRCRVMVDNAAGDLRPGLLAQVRLILETRTGLTIVPAAALRSTSGGWEASVKTGDGFAARPVKVGWRTAEGVEILAGLQPGEVVALWGE